MKREPGLGLESRPHPEPGDEPEQVPEKQEERQEPEQLPEEQEQEQEPELVGEQQHPRKMQGEEPPSSDLEVPPSPSLVSAAVRSSIRLLVI